VGKEKTIWRLGKIAHYNLVGSNCAICSGQLVTLEAATHDIESCDAMEEEEQEKR
jgi:hypothetical protein